MCETVPIYSPERELPQDNGTLRIWFVRGIGFSDCASVWRSGWWHRHPALTIQLIGTWLIGVLFRSRLRHCLIEVDGLVLDPTWTCEYLYDSDMFLRKYPHIEGCFVFQWPGLLSRKHPLAARFKRGRIRQVRSVGDALWRNLLMLATFGRWRGRDFQTCVDLARQYLMLSGHVVRGRPWHPPGLHRQLIKDGYVFNPLPSPAPAPERGSGEAT